MVVAAVSALVALGSRGVPAESVVPAIGVSPSSAAAPNASPSAPSVSPSAQPSTRSPSAAPSAQSGSTPKAAPKRTLLQIPAKGPQTYVRATVAKKWTSTQGGRVLRYDVRIEKGLPFDADDTARLIQSVLDDPRSWTGSGEVRWQLVKPGQKADLHAYVVTPKTTDALCAPLLTRGEVSCQNGDRVVLNAKRWAFGAKAYGKDVAGYRRYLVNHEFGHALGRQHVTCPGRGKRAPVMMQQTKGLGGCKANPWPSPKRT